MDGAFDQSDFIDWVGMYRIHRGKVRVLRSPSNSLRKAWRSSSCFFMVLRLHASPTTMVSLASNVAIGIRALSERIALAPFS